MGLFKVLFLVGLGCFNQWFNFLTLPFLAVSSSVNEVTDGETGSMVGGVVFHEDQLTRSSDVALKSLPTMHIEEQKPEFENGELQNQHLFAADANGRVCSSSCPEPIGSQVTIDSHVDKNLLQSHLSNCIAQRKYFAPHWPAEAVRKALEVCLAIFFILVNILK